MPTSYRANLRRTLEPVLKPSRCRGRTDARRPTLSHMALVARGSMLCTGVRIPECARPMTRCRSLSDCGGTPVLAGGCRHFNSLQCGVAPDQALAARDSWCGDLLQGPVAQRQPFHSSARTPRPGAPTETSCQVPLWRLPFASQAGDTSPTVIVCLHRLRPRRRQGLRLRTDGNGRGRDGPTGTLCQASGGPGPTPGLRSCRSWWCR